MAHVYRHIRLDKNEVFYIGIGSTSYRAKSTYSRNKYWQNVVKSTEYKIEIMLENLSWEEACKKEVELISTYGRKDLGLGTLVNMTNGGDGTVGILRTDEHTEKIRKAKAGFKHTEDSKRKMRESSTNKTEEYREKQRIAAISRPPITEETRIKLKKPKPQSHRVAHYKPVTHIETGLQFRSQEEAAKYFNISPSGVIRRLKKGIFIYNKED